MPSAFRKQRGSCHHAPVADQISNRLSLISTLVGATTFGGNTQHENENGSQRKTAVGEPHAFHHITNRGTPRDDREGGVFETNRLWRGPFFVVDKIAIKLEGDRHKLVPRPRIVA